MSSLPDIRLETERLILRTPIELDGPAVAAFFQSNRARYVDGPFDEEDAWYVFYTECGHWALHGFGMFMLTEKASAKPDAPIGMAGLFKMPNWEQADLGYMLFSETHEGRGLAYEAAMAVRRFAYDDLGWTTVCSSITPGNARSIRMAERMGAVLDPDAVAPDEGDVVYRHPAPEALQ
ncbi:MAG: GNAT family N-acetyltransferase [Pseudomonadota bacterium]